MMSKRTMATVLAGAMLAALPAAAAQAAPGSTCTETEGFAVGDTTNPGNVDAFTVSTGQDGITFGIDGTDSLAANGTEYWITADLDRRADGGQYEIKVGRNETRAWATTFEGTSQVPNDLGFFRFDAALVGDRIEVTLPYEIVQDGTIEIGQPFNDARNVGSVIHELPAVGRVTNARLEVKTREVTAPDGVTATVQDIRMTCGVVWKWSPSAGGGDAADVALGAANPSTDFGALLPGESVTVTAAEAGLVRLRIDPDPRERESFITHAADGRRYSFAFESAPWVDPATGLTVQDGMSSTLPNAGGTTYTFTVPADYPYGAVDVTAEFEPQASYGQAKK